MTQAEIKIEGLRDFNRALRKIDTDLGKRLPRAMKQTIEQTIVPDARRRYRAQYTQRSGRHVRRIRAFASGRNAGVRGGGGKYPEFPGQEFGSYGGDGKKQFPAYRPYRGNDPKIRYRGGEGYAIFPAGRAAVPKLSGDIRDEIYKIAGEAGLKRSFGRDFAIR